ncbi:MAG: BREX-4 system phosphatase PglZ [Oscillospiraceae bacterium]|nr:BREX-4 system phosphatase PglZ [Oscillospiraceae bacterium]
MTIQEAVSKLQNERQNKVPSRFPCRAIMVSNIEQYCFLLSELKKINGTRVIKSDELFSSPDVMPNYSNLMVDSYHDEWVILTGVSEYLRLFSKSEAENRRFITLWKNHVPATSIGRIIIPLWGCEAQWYDPSLNLSFDERQEDFYLNCIDSQASDNEQEMSLLILSNAFEQQLSMFEYEGSKQFIGIKAWLEYWENPSEPDRSFILVTRQYNGIATTSGNVEIRVIKNKLEFIQENMLGGINLTKDNCSPEMQEELFDFAKQNTPLDAALLKLFNLSAFSEIDVMRKWKSGSDSYRGFVWLWYQLYSDESYLSYCFSRASDVCEILSLVTHEIFYVWRTKSQWIDEFKSLRSVMSLTPDSDYYSEVDRIPEFEERLDFLSGSIQDDRVYLVKMVGQWLKVNPAQAKESKKLKEIFPELGAYLSRDIDVLKNDIGDYLSRYKVYKLENTLPMDEEVYFGGVNAESLEKRYSILSQYEDDETLILWVDALGAEWLSLLHWALVSKSKCNIKRVELAQATLPTETCFNEQWKAMNVAYNKLNGLDKLAHKGAVDDPSYYSCIVEQMNFVTGISDKVSSLLSDYRRVVITGDHGTSRLAARFFHSREGLAAPKNAEVYSHGRYCKIIGDNEGHYENTKIVKGKDENVYSVFGNYDHYKLPGFATNADDDKATFGEIHGGATPEEMIVPVIVVEGDKEIKLTAKWKESSVKISIKKAKLSITFNHTVEHITARIKDSFGETTDVGNKTWQIVFANAKAGNYHVEIIADGQMVDMPDVTFQSALGGDGDLPW